ncbi:beta-1,4-galactosyltransferase 4-like [Asterias rubens]|uniref:beta-1,4-galactosyltransferase 4-like n=1 Tax=Asterias rubens TaxID=7604 RepID=UPI001455078B|nr:beta-1,4-galactosyltransferase 4-like [Asterias rubens]
MLVVRKIMFGCLLLGVVCTLICMRVLHLREAVVIGRIVTVSSNSLRSEGVLTESGLTEMVKNPHQKPENACPELQNIPNLENDREMDLSTTIEVNEVEHFVFDNRLQEIRDAVSTGHTLKKEGDIGGDNSSNHTLERLASLGVQHGGYIYIPGGIYRPGKCRSRWRVAIVVPFRNRTAQLATFLRYMVPFLQKQLLEFGIFVINQENDLLFNRGMLMNIGFLESQHFSNWDCYVFHDVDQIPQSEFNPYECINMPRHFVSGADNRNYSLPYSSYFGGVVGFKSAQFRLINGLSNVYWGWCCEDDDLGQRLTTAQLRTNRYSGRTGHYKAITKNHFRSSNHSAGESENRENLRKSRRRFKTDGLNSIRYSKPHIELHTLYTNISVDIRRL